MSQATPCFAASLRLSRRRGPVATAPRRCSSGCRRGARHELGGLIFATSLRRHGIPVIYLGADLPLDDWVAAVERTDARAVVIGAVMPTDASAARSVAVGLRAVRPELIIAFGGAAAPDPDGSLGSPATTIRLPADVGDAVEVLVGALMGLATQGAGRTS